MPNCASAKKRLRQDKVRRGRNRATKSVLRLSIRKVREAVDAGEVDKAQENYVVAAKRLDQAGSSRLIHPNKAARTKSRLQKLISGAKK